MTGLGTKLARTTPPIAWLTAPTVFTLSARQAHVWKVDLSQASSLNYATFLSSDERDRAGRFRFERDSQRYIAAHVALRLILSRYANLATASLVFAETEYGKPFLVNTEAQGLLFNMSHSGDVALIAVTREREVGIDVEFMRADFATSEVAENFFSVAEIYTLSGLHPRERTRAFFNCWTRKEAYVKARGEGLSMPLDQFDVSLAPGVPAAMLGNRIDESEKNRWILHDLQTAPNYAGALVIEALQTPPRLSFFAFS
jgi:4'-phosphopantetheinyl transferase